VRRCKCGCGASLEGKRPEARYASDACRARAWKGRTGYRRENGRNGTRNASPRPVALRISLRRAQTVADELIDTLDAAAVSPAGVRRIIDAVLVQSLSERQRQRLEDERAVA
jgi:hypothetical protein